MKMPIKNPKWRNLFLLVLGFTIIVIFFEVIPRILNDITLISDWIEQSNRIDRIGEVEKALEISKKENSRLRKNIGSIVSNYEDKQKISSVLSSIDNIAKKAKVSLDRIIPKEVSYRDNLLLQPIEIELTSQYENYYNFIRFLENSPKVIIVKEIAVHQLESGSKYLKIDTKLEVYLNL